MSAWRGACHEISKTGVAPDRADQGELARDRSAAQPSRAAIASSVYSSIRQTATSAKSRRPGRRGADGTPQP